MRQDTGGNVRSTSYRPDLDGLRGIAVVLVVWCHFWPTSHVPGALGVDIFFVLSGYLITTLLLAELEQRGRVRLWRFYARRVARLYPALLLMLAVAAPLALASPVTRAVGLHVWHNAALAASYTGNYAAAGVGNLEPFRHTWSLAVEEQFYVVWPLVLALLLRFGRRAAGLTALGLCLISWEWLAVGFNLSTFDTWGYRTEVRGGGLLLGCALALLAPRLNRWAGHLGLVALVATLTAGTLGLGPLWLPYLLVPLSTAAMIATPLQCLTARPLVAVGRVSYSLYLWHYPFVSLTRGWTLPARVAVLCFACAAAVASYHLVERPVRRWASTGLGGGGFAAPWSVASRDDDVVPTAHCVVL